MILNQGSENTIIQTGSPDPDSIEMGMDVESMQHLMMLLSTNLYTDNIGTPIQELASNALDSHREASIDEPIIVGLTQEGNQWTFSVEDFGLGLDSDDFKNILSKYGKSTKRNNANLLGAMGIGAKSPFSYTDSYYFICRKNGVERKYLLYKAAIGFKIDLLHEEPTTERNGVKVAYPIKSFHFTNFREAILQKMSYFEGVYLKVANNDYNTTFKIYRNELFQASSLSRYTKLHLCLDNVVYPIDFDKLGIDNIDIPVALRFGLSDGIMPTPNRESIMYTDTAKDLILDRIKQLATWCVSKYNKDEVQFANVMDSYAFFEDDDRFILIPEMNKKFRINDLLDYSAIPMRSPEIRGLKHLSAELFFQERYVIFDNYKIVGKITRGKYTAKIREHSHGGSIYWNIRNRDTKLMLKRDFSLRRINYLKDLYNSVTFIVPVYERKLTWYWQHLGLKKFPKNMWREVIQEYQAVVKTLTAEWMDENDIVIPQEWIDARKSEKSYLYKSKKVDRVEGEIAVAFGKLMKYPHHTWACKFEGQAYKIADMAKHGKLVIYGIERDRPFLDALWTMSLRNQRLIPAVIGALEQPKIKGKFHNWINIHEFMKGTHRLFKLYTTTKVVTEFIDAHEWLFNKDTLKLIEELSKEMHSMLNKIMVYANKNRYEYDADNEVMALMVAKSKELNQWDTSIWDIFQKVEKLAPIFDFVQIIPIRKNSDSYPAAMKVVKDVLTLRKYKMDYTVYLPDFNTDALDTVEAIINSIEKERLEGEGVEEDTDIIEDEDQDDDIDNDEDDDDDPDNDLELEPVEEEVDEPATTPEEPVYQIPLDDELKDEDTDVTSIIESQYDPQVNV